MFELLDWASIATISTLPEIKSYPFVSLESISDGPRDNSTGMLYFYLTPLDTSSQDIRVSNKTIFFIYIITLNESL